MPKNIVAKLICCLFLRIIKGKTYSSTDLVNKQIAEKEDLANSFVNIHEKIKKNKKAGAIKINV